MNADFVYRATFLCSIPVLWLGVCITLSWASGWWMLSRKFSETSEAKERRQREHPESAWMRTGRLGAINYHSTLNFAVDDTGLWISVFPLFRFGHPRLFIPWSSMHHVRRENKLYSHRVRLSIGKPTVTQALFPGWVRYRIPQDSDSEYLD